MFLAGYSSTSPVHDLLILAAAGDCELLSSEYAFDVARRNLRAKGPSGAIEQFETATAMIVHVNEASGTALAQARSIGLSDDSDVPILAAALQARAHALVTGDRRAFGAYFGKQIWTLKILRLRDALVEILGDD